MRYLYLQWTMTDDGETADFVSASIISHEDPKNVKIFNNREDVWNYLKKEPCYVYVINTECVKYLFKSFIDKKKEWTKEYQGILFNIYKKGEKKDDPSKLEIQFRDFTALEKRECDIFEMQKLIVNHEKINKKLSRVPITISVYERRAIRKAARSDRKYMRRYKGSKLNDTTYTLVNACFHGSWVGLNPKYEERITKNVYHNDFVSHYPTQLRKHKFPMGKLFETHDSVEDILKQDEDYTYFLKISMEDFKLKKDLISMVKSDWFRKQHIRGKERYVLFITNVTLRYFYEQYNIKDLVIEYQYCAKNYDLPESFVAEIDKAFIEKYKAKAELELHRNTEDEEWFQFLYDQAKIRLNSIFGEFARDPIKYIEGKNIKEKLRDYYNCKANFVIYTIGVMVTEYARAELFDFMKLIGYDNIIYGDTDSLFYVTDEAYEKVKAKNVELRETAPYAEYEGKRFYYDEFKFEEKLDYFKALHSKCYATVKDGVFKTKIAGIPDKVNGMTRDKEVGNMFNFNVGLTFTKCTPTIIKECPGGYKLIKLKKVVLGDEREHAKLLKLLAVKEA